MADTARTIRPAESWYCLCSNPQGDAHTLNSASTTRCRLCHMHAPWLERCTPQMVVRQIRIPQGSPGDFSGWFTFVRGAMVGRRSALRILILGPMRSRIQTVQSNNPELWS